MAAAPEPRLPAAALAQAPVLQARLLLCLCVFREPVAPDVPKNALDTGRRAAALPAAAALADQMWSPVLWPASANRMHSAYKP